MRDGPRCLLGERNGPVRRQQEFTRFLVACLHGGKCRCRMADVPFRRIELVNFLTQADVQTVMVRAIQIDELRPNPALAV
jgi:hypothetical protein